jgi:predicted GIY-YIG superfamily endonuclease
MPEDVPPQEPAAVGRWVDAEHLQADDVLILRDGLGTVSAVEHRFATEPVYNFEVAELHTYAVGACGVLVHNRGARFGGATAKPASKKKDEVVYVHKDKKGKVIYIGITDHPKRRSIEHKNDPEKLEVKMEVITEKLTHGQARTIEAKLIRERLLEARARKKLTNEMSIEEQLVAAGCKRSPAIARAVKQQGFPGIFVD